MIEGGKLVVEGLGRIRKAEIELGALTLIVGENNSGKSWLAALLWSLVSRRSTSFASMQPKLIGHPLVDRVEAIMSGPIGVHRFDSAFNAEFASFAASIPRLFAVRRALSALGTANARSIDWNEGARRTTPAFDRISIQQRTDENVKWAQGPSGITYFREADEPARDALRMLDILFERENGTPRTRYMPGSRTGFMHMHKLVIGAAIDRLSRDVHEGSNLTPAMTDFLQWLAFAPFPESQPASDTLGRLLQDGMAGELRVVRPASTSVNAFYLDVSDGTRLPMHLTSSLVTELAPLLLMLREEKLPHFLVIEEPESHLHPAMQRMVARVIMRLVRRGVRVLVTTHGDNFSQQINNFVKLGALPEHKRHELQTQLGYEPDDYLTPDELRGYELRIVDGQSESAPLEVGDAGMAQPLFNEELRRLTDEVRTLRTALLDARTDDE